MSNLLFPDRDTDLYRALSWQLTDAQNYPEHIQPHVLGSDMSPLVDAVYSALKADGYTKDIDPNARYPIAGFASKPPTV